MFDEVDVMYLLRKAGVKFQRGWVGAASIEVDEAIATGLDVRLERRRTVGECVVMSDCTFSAESKTLADSKSAGRIVRFHLGTGGSRARRRG